jgi:hypothetical protein
MAYMAQQAVRTAVRDAFRDRPDALRQADEAARFRRWMHELPIDPALVAAIAEPVVAIEEGLRDADRLRGREADRRRELEADRPGRAPVRGEVDGS